MEFQWSIGSVSSSKGNPVLKFISFYDSPYETPATIAKFDTLGLKGHIVLIEGLTTGTAKVICLELLYYIIIYIKLLSLYVIC